MVEAFKIVGGNKIAGELKSWWFKELNSSNNDSDIGRKRDLHFKKCPDLRDIRTLVALLESLGLEVEKLDANSYKIINNGL